MSKKLYIKTMGCQMNVYDSQKMIDILSSLGYKTVAEPNNADLMILNTCHIREKATEKVFSDLGRLRIHKEQRAKNGKKTLIGVAGCVAQAEGDIITERAKYVDMVFGPQTYHLLPEMLLKANGNERVINTEFPEESKFDSLPKSTLKDSPSAYLSVQEGCDKFCTYCVVPYTRGSEFSRPKAMVINEARQLVDNGVKEITLLGQNVNAYNGGATLAELIDDIAQINGLERIRYTTSHPNDMQDDLIYAHRDIKKLMPYLHLPLQSGSNHILELMNRKHTVEKYIEVLDKVKAARPDIALSSDFIVGFPGETDADHQATLDVIKQIDYSACYSFKYSPRPGTPGATMSNMVAEHVKKSRLEELQKLLFEKQLKFNQSFIGKTLPILFDRKGQNKGQLLGRTPYMQSIYVDAPMRLFGEILNVKIDKANQNSLSGNVITTENKETTPATYKTERAAA